ncbi:hypothetical protein GYH30_049562 [Glycine max]|nr:hypothetical protein GYH30_049562 [Glycine max]
MKVSSTFFNLLSCVVVPLSIICGDEGDDHRIHTTKSICATSSSTLPLIGEIEADEWTFSSEHVCAENMDMDDQAYLCPMMLLLHLMVKSKPVMTMSMLVGNVL